MQSNRELRRGWVIYPRATSSMTDESCRWLISQAGLQGLDIEILFCEDISCVVGESGFGILHNDTIVDTLPEFAIVRGYDFVLMQQLESMGVKLFNSSKAMSISLDKFATHQRLVASDVDTIPTISNCRSFSTNSKLLGLPFILKYSRGSRGKEVYMIETCQEFEECLSLYSEIITQTVVGSSLGRDIRVWVVGGVAVEAVMRYSESSFKSNYSLGGSVARVELTSELSGIAARAAIAVGLDFAGVDLLISDSGYVVCEVNGNAAFRSIFSIESNNMVVVSLFSYIGRSL